MYALSNGKDAMFIEEDPDDMPTSTASIHSGDDNNNNENNVEHSTTTIVTGSNDNKKR